MTLHTNKLRFTADKDVDLTNGVHLEGFISSAKSELSDAANEIDRLRFEVALLNVQLTYATKVKSNGG